MQNTNLQFEMYNLDKFLNQYFSYDILMPVPFGEKRPEFAHRDGAWSWEKFHNTSLVAGPRDLGVLLRDLCVVDVDGFDIASDLERRFPVLTTAPCEQTNHGYHYWFRRPAIATEMRYFDGASQREAKIDFKSISANGTSGFVVVAPSTNKLWIRPLWSTPIVDIPLELLETVAMPRSKVVDEMTLQFEDNVAWTVTDCRWLNLMSYFEPFVSNELKDAMVPCDADSFYNLYQLLQTNELSYMSPTQERFFELLRISDMLGLKEKSLKRIALGLARCQVDMFQACPEWWRTRIDERRWRESGAEATNFLYDVNESLAASLMYEPLECMSNRSMWLFPVVWPPTYNDTRVLVSDPVITAERSLPPLVQSLLLQYHGNLVICGGAILGAVARHAGEGSDYDLFIVGLNDEEANEMLQKIMRDNKHVINNILRTGNSITIFTGDIIVQFILRLYENVAQVLVGFDLAPSKIGAYYDDFGTFKVECSPAFLPALKHMAFALDTTKWGYASVARHLKYHLKGFQIYIPGHRRSAARIDAKGRSHGLIALFRAESRILKYRNKKFKDAPLTNHEVKSAVKGLRFMTDYTTVAKLTGALKHVIKSVVRHGKEILFGSYIPTAVPRKNRDISNIIFARCDFTKDGQFAVYHPLDANVWEAYRAADLASSLHYAGNPYA